MKKEETSRPSETVAAETGSYVIEPGERVAVTGGGGFIGSAVLRQLIERKVSPVVLVQPGGDTRNLDGLDVERITVDLRDPKGVSRALDGARTVFHMAALYRFWAAEPRSFYEVNVEGTLNVLRAVQDAEVGRLVYTSTVGTLGLRGVTSSAPADETSYAEVDHLFGLYKQSKYVAEHEVLRAAAEGLPVVLVQPTAPVGPRDRRPTPTGATVVEFLNGRFPGFVDTTLNVVDVEDVARGHILAAERGLVGRSYLLGGENLSFQKVLWLLAEATGLPAPTRRFPYSLALVAAWASDVIEGRLLRRQPSIPLEGARMANTHMAIDDSRARAELGYTSRPAGEALARAARWFVEAGYVNAARLKRLHWGA